MKYILAHPTLIMQLSTFSDYAIHHGMARLAEMMVMVMGGV